MPVLINWKICDNDKACGGIAVCPTGALYWNEVESTIGILNDYCTSCRKCVVEGCPVGAIVVTETAEEYELAQREISDDPHDKEQLFIDRFGAAPISEDVLINKDSIKDKVLSGVTLIERYTDSSIQCLVHSISVDDVRYETGISFSYYKCEDSEADETTEYPVLDIYVNGALKGAVEGYYSEDQFSEFVEKILNILA